jgi:hypothetical protein
MEGLNKSDSESSNNEDSNLDAIIE